MKPGVDDSNWSTGKNSPGAITCQILPRFWDNLVLYGHLVIALYINFEYLGDSTVTRRLGRPLIVERIQSFLNNKFTRGVVLIVCYPQIFSLLPLLPHL